MNNNARFITRANTGGEWQESALSVTFLVLTLDIKRIKGRGRDVLRRMSIRAYNIQQHSATFSEDLRFYVVDDEFGEKTISILLDGEESEMVFIDHPHVEMSVSIRSLARTANRKDERRAR